jgi:AraC family transcriptional regulator
MSSSSRHRLEYQNRVNRVVDYIQAHRGGDLSLEALAQVGAFSPYHFHRIFKAVVGENLKEFVQRVRLEWAGSALVSRPQVDVLEIALDAGFQSASAFARAFKERFGMTATDWRRGGAVAWSKERSAIRNPGQQQSKPCKAGAEASTHLPLREDDEPSSRTEDIVNVTVKTVPSQRVAYMRYVGPYGASSGIPQLWMRLQRWAAARDLWSADRLCVGVAHDDPRVTDPNKCRYDAGIAIPAGFEVDTQVNVVDIAGAKFAIAAFEGTANDVAAAWDRVFAEWLPESGYQPDDGPFLELYRGEAFDEKTGVVRCELCTPVRPL